MDLIINGYQLPDPDVVCQSEYRTLHEYLDEVTLDADDEADRTDRAVGALEEFILRAQSLLASIQQASTTP